MPTIPSSWLRSSPSNVPYHFLLKYAESFERDANTSTAFIETPFGSTDNLKRDWFGSATYLGGGPQLMRTLPYASAYNQIEMPVGSGTFVPNQFLDRMDLLGFQPEKPDAAHVASDPATGWPEVDGYAQYQLTFNARPYSLLSDADAKAAADAQNAISANSCVPEMFRFLRLTRRYLPESRKIPTAGFEVYDPAGDTVPPGAFKPFVIQEVGSIPTFQVEIVAETIFWPAANFPDGGVITCLGTVNVAAIFLNGNLFQPGTLLYKGPASELTPYKWIDGNFYFDVPHLFGYRSDGWNNHRLNAPIAGQQWWPIRAKGVAGNQPLFQSADHTKVFSPEPSH